MLGCIGRSVLLIGVLTYMSIREMIEFNVKEGRLFPLTPVMPDAPIERMMLLSQEMENTLLGIGIKSSFKPRIGRLRDDLESFVTGRVISLELKPYTAREAYMARLDKPTDEVWDIRSRDPSPALRVFGRFAEQDIFIAFFWEIRKRLGDKQSPCWAPLIRRCKADWRKLFNPYPPHSGNTIHDYVSENAIPS